LNESVYAFLHSFSYEVYLILLTEIGAAAIVTLLLSDDLSTPLPGKLIKSTLRSVKNCAS